MFDEEKENGTMIEPGSEEMDGSAAEESGQGVLGPEGDDINLDDFPGFFEEDEAEADPHQGEARAAEPPAENEQTEQLEAGAAKGEEPLHTIRYNHQDLKLTESQLKELAQKGMNYDKLSQRLEQTKQGPSGKAMEVLEAYARQEGVPVDEYLGFLEERIAASQVQQLVEGGMTPEAAQRYRQMEQQVLRQQLVEERAKAEEAGVKAFLPLVNKYPGLTFDKLPPAVTEAIAAGAEPLAAYESHLKDGKIERLKAQLAAGNVAAKNKQTLPGSARGLGDREEKDAFLSGFDGD